MNYIATRSFSTTVNGRRYSVNIGGKVTAARYNKLSKRLKEMCVTARQWSSQQRAKYSREEYTFIAQSYVNYVTPETHESCEAYISDQFNQEFPGHGHGDSSVIMVICQIKQVDALYPAMGLDGASVILMEELESVAPGRFSKAAGDAKRYL